MYYDDLLRKIHIHIYSTSSHFITTFWYWICFYGVVEWYILKYSAFESVWGNICNENLTCWDITFLSHVLSLFLKKKCFEIRNSNLSLFCKLHHTNIYKNKCDHLYQSTLRIFILWSWLHRSILVGLYFSLKDWNQNCSNWILNETEFTSFDRNDFILVWNLK